MNPAFLLGTAFNIAYWHRKYHSGTICKGVSNPQTSNALSGKVVKSFSYLCSPFSGFNLVKEKMKVGTGEPAIAQETK